MSTIKKTKKLIRSIKILGIRQSLKIIEDALCITRPAIKYAETTSGKFYLICNDALSENVASEKAHEPHFHEITKLLLRDTDNVMDLGANLGTYSIWMSRLVSNGHVISFEPLGLTFSQLQLNLLANKIRNVTTYKLALSNVTGEYLQMEPIDYSLNALNIGVTRVTKEVRGNGDGVLSLRLDDLDLPKIHFVKMDIQGSEYSALLGMRKIIDRDRPWLFIELEEVHLKSCRSSTKEVIEYLFSLNYTLFRIKTEYPCDHLCIPNEKLHDFESTILNQMSYQTDKLQGREIELIFSENGCTYSNYKIC